MSVTAIVKDRFDKAHTFKGETLSDIVDQLIVADPKFNYVDLIGIFGLNNKADIDWMMKELERMKMVMVS